jgi:flagellar biosynthesis/type III secretory pathway M-ring protein FliF/YscJ
MHAVTAAIARFAEDTPTPSPSPSDVDPNLVTPGVAGFVLIAILALVVVFLVWDMMRRIRRGRYRAEIREELDAEQLAAEQADDAERETDVDDQDVDPRTN